ncbi:M15 family metallopeptidase [Bradyrhizobium pachyrhizi]|uniref:M15 family metallopeptidase n=1 Tax=Bradyrhizobium pachyrhizi TaxID=280333 RepID=UPI000A72EBDF|nr:M15 family metallopeptidase [Bradyrhizobium pachyrhizi]
MTAFRACSCQVRRLENRRSHCRHRADEHAGYAAAIDLNLKVSDDWLWAGKGKTIPCENRMPREIVDIVERHGCIRGGKWCHYDTMHFEHRPELLGK